MANYAGTPVIVHSTMFGGQSAKHRKMKTMQLTLSTAGSATNNIPASALGFTYIEGCGSAVLSDNSAIYPCTPSYDGTLLLVGGGSSGAPQDISGTILICVWGY